MKTTAPSFALLRLGARGVVLKQSANLLVKSIHRVHAGEIWLDNRMTAEVIGALAQSSNNGAGNGKRLISDREREAPIVSLILKVLRDPDFPKRDREARINFLADSLAARGAVTPRTSRDICARERAKDRARQRHRIMRREFYIECSCGCQGPTYKGRCPRRHPEAMQSPEIVWGLRSF